MIRRKRTFNMLMVPTFRSDDEKVLDDVVLQIIRTKSNQQLLAVKAIISDSRKLAEINARQIAGQFGPTAHTWPITVLLTRDRLLEVMLSDPWDTYQDKNFWVFTGDNNAVSRLLALVGKQPEADRQWYQLQLSSTGRRVTDFRLAD